MPKGLVRQHREVRRGLTEFRPTKGLKAAKALRSPHLALPDQALPGAHGHAHIGGGRTALRAQRPDLRPQLRRGGQELLTAQAPPHVVLSCLLPLNEHLNALSRAPEATQEAEAGPRILRARAAHRRTTGGVRS